ncbi:hypothetical protein M413DRAFT_445052 [Hebeloma cylindrosporum]|uniref:Uncharacterized protein n=1 Tax=Hebeloma cylindrosporum TaxID=76867 RepID=A0A0C2XW07_HEBCY|nr:hypothetical protein M413DRAFT_445052 [Hebeloma cylindrosporum h7]
MTVRANRHHGELICSTHLGPWACWNREFEWFFAAYVRKEASGAWRWLLDILLSFDNDHKPEIPP